MRFHDLPVAGVVRVLLGLGLIFYRRFHDPAFAGSIEPNHNRPRRGDGTAFSVDHRVDTHH